MHKNDDINNNKNQTQLKTKTYTNNLTTNSTIQSFQPPLNQQINQNYMLSQINFFYLFTPISTNEVQFRFNLLNPYRINHRSSFFQTM